MRDAPTAIIQSLNIEGLGAAARTLAPDINDIKHEGIVLREVEGPYKLAIRFLKTGDKPVRSPNRGNAITGIQFSVTGANGKRAEFTVRTDETIAGSLSFNALMKEYLGCVDAHERAIRRDDDDMDARNDARKQAHLRGQAATETLFRDHIADADWGTLFSGLTMAYAAVTSRLTKDLQR